jgi:hypothetical protein
MKRIFIAASLLAAYFAASAQKGNESTVYKKQQISKTDIQALFSYYTQDGNHSAVTGGTGTEALQVFVSDITVTRQRDSITTLQLEAGVDVITSASTDNIDFVLSSASRDDRRFHIAGAYSRLLKHSNIRAGINAGFSIESDYMSIPVGISVSHDNKMHTRQVSASLQCYFDDLRWGRFDPDYYKPETLVYPVEMRYQQWFDIYRRQSYNLSFAINQVINQRMQLAIYPELVYQTGLLSTPFHRVYFNDLITLKVENLPRTRWKVPLAAQLNTFIGNKVILRSYYRFYKDNFGITGHTVQFEIPIKTSPLFTLTPLVRLYTQTPTRYFRPRGQHLVAEEYYTSDYDLSRFTSYKLGLTGRYAFFKPMFKNSTFQDASLRYTFYKRSDQLSAHAISLLLDFRHNK